MSEHLPECPQSTGCHCPWMPECEGCDCICDRLRACEQRVRDESWDHGMEVGTHSALDAAREAVESLNNVTYDTALAAIDALRKEQK